MSDTVTVHFFFDAAIDRSILRPLVQVASETGTIADDGVNGDVDSVTDRVDAGGDRIEFIYEDIAYTVVPDRLLDGLPDIPTVTLRLDDLYFEVRQGLNSESDVLTHSDQLIELVETCYDRLVEAGNSPLYVVGLGPGDADVLSDPAFDETLSAGGLRDGNIEMIAWLQILPPQVVDRYGRDVLTTAPASYVDARPDGGLSLVVDTSPTMIEATYEPERVQTHLGI